jgi:hypothetical protein
VNDAKQKCRSPQEMMKIRAEENRVRQENEEEQAENIQKAANIEDQMRREDIDRRSSNRQSKSQAPFRPPSSTINDSELDSGDKGPLALNILVIRDNAINLN